MEISEIEFNKLINSEVDLNEEKEKIQSKLKDIYFNLLDLHNKYCDLDKIYPNIIVCWEIGTYLHDLFPSYPFLHFNATKGGGKSRTMKLVASCSKEGQMCNSMTEAVLFRTKGTLCIDEFESIGRKGVENLKELLNSAYKKGVKVKRMKKKRTLEGEEQVVEEFDVYRPICLANIWGLDDVLGDRSIPIILDKSNKISVINLIEIWEQEKEFLETKTLLNDLFMQKRTFSVVMVVSLLSPSVYMDWNNYLLKETYNNTISLTQNNTKQQKSTKLFFQRFHQQPQRNIYIPSSSFSLFGDSN